MPTVLLTGATGYIASHTWLQLQSAGYDVVGLDNFCNSSPLVLDRIAELGGRAVRFHQADVADTQTVTRVLETESIDAVVHFAALKAVGESVQMPLAYFRNNIGGLISVCEAMRSANVFRFVFSSSATVYGAPQSLPIREDAPLSATNPYGTTKLCCEELLRELQRCDERWKVAILRYFNPVGAHPSGRLGEDPRGIPNNLMPYVSQVAVGRREKLQVFGNDYDTPDGTGVRDYIHVVDLADGHVAALRYLFDHARSTAVNLGTGQGYSVLSLVEAYEAASGKSIPYEIVARRPGDVASCYADPTLAKEQLGWAARFALDDMCRDSWRWQSLNPRGYAA